MNLFLFFGFFLFSSGVVSGLDILKGLEATLDNLKKGFESTLQKIFAYPKLIPSLKKQKYTPDTTSSVKDEYDFIIVGAGSAGSVLANRLSVNPCVSVLLLEAGSAPPVFTEIPAIERFFVHTKIDWGFHTVSQKRSARNLINRQVIYASGKTFGGSSTLNDVQYSVGNRADYDGWEAMGAQGWGYKDVRKYFMKLEDNRDTEYANDGNHGVGGPQTISKPPYTAELKAPLFEAAKYLNIPQVDPAGPNQIGIYDIQGTERDGQLCSVAKSYLVPVDFRSNLDIVGEAFVRKILITDKVAVGVEYELKGKKLTVYARKEVIISAGTINTPKLLMLSGIGPAQVLQKYKIEVVSDLPGVGRNLQDHVGSSENFLVNNTINVGLKLADPSSIAMYVHNRTGPFAAAQLVVSLAFLQNPKPRFTNLPDHQLYFVEFSSILPLLDFHLKPQVFAKIYLKYVGRAFYGCLIHLLHPRSRGNVTIKSADPNDPPVIDPNYFEDPEDIQDIVEGLKNCRRISETPPMKSIGAERFDTLFPGCEKYEKDVDKYYTCMVRSTPVTFYHYAGTAKMGNPNDPMTVVDPQLRVIGVERLRVVDSSVMPTITTGNTNVPTIMIAEKASDMILSTFNCQNYNQSSQN